MLWFDCNNGFLTRCAILQMVLWLLQSFALLLTTLIVGTLSTDPPVSSSSPLSIAPIAPASLAPGDSLVCETGLSCLGRCDIYHVECSCQCDGDCNVVGDCCHDAFDACGIVAVVPVAPFTQSPIAPSTQSPIAPDGSLAPVSQNSTYISSIPVSQLCDSGVSCADRCGLFDSTCTCQCDSTCADSGDCCEDFASQCSAPIELSESPTVISTSPSQPPVVAPTKNPTDPATDNPTDPPTKNPTDPPTKNPTDPATNNPTDPPTYNPTDPPTYNPTDPPTYNQVDPATENPTGPLTETGNAAPTVTGTRSPAKFKMSRRMRKRGAGKETSGGLKKVTDKKDDVRSKDCRRRSMHRKHG